MRLTLIPMELKDANAFVDMLHRHHKHTQGHRFSIGCIDEDNVVHGVAIVGRPVSRYTNHHTTLEVTRLCTDGTPNACSFLYSAAARIGRALGYKKIQTFILETEPGTSLIASGWEFEKVFEGGAWKQRKDGCIRTNDFPICAKLKFVKAL